MNGYPWRIHFVQPDHVKLVDRTHKLRVATTDPITRTVYLSNSLNGDFLVRVFVHELGHCVIFSYHLLDDIHRMVKPEHWIEAEEWICNFLADYGLMAFNIAYHLLDEDAWVFALNTLDNLF